MDTFVKETITTIRIMNVSILTYFPMDLLVPPTHRKQLMLSFIVDYFAFSKVSKKMNYAASTLSFPDFSLSIIF